MSLTRFTIHGWIGLVLIATMWPMSWLQIQPVAEHHFFFLWLGYILIVDVLVLTRRGSSLLSRSRLAFAGLFFASLPVWWLFEFFNRFVKNWIYLGVEHYGPIRYAMLASLAFSTVVPAVFETTELMATFDFVEGFKDRRAVPVTRLILVGIVVFGLLSFVAMVLWPRYAFPLAWTCVFFVVDPINYALGWPSITAWVSRGDWRPVITLGAGTLLCGIFWEMWNFYAWPKWIYEIPFVEFLHIFEMPLLGYGGYLPFGLELFAIYHFIRGLVGLADVPYVNPVPDRFSQATQRVWHTGLEPTN
ncbi:MAG: hypothetical protein ACE5LU_13530 [Anaerolineae bacterium]